jgi:hypothetical protein
MGPRLCPLRVNATGSCFYPCVETCSWYIPERKSCAINEIGYSSMDISDVARGERTLRVFNEDDY